MMSGGAERTFALDERTFEFARDVRLFVKNLPRTICNIEDGKQLVRSSGSVGANYIEANESLSKKDFRLRVRISRKEAKESRYWMRLLDTQGSDSLEATRHRLIGESQELVKILSAILNAFDDSPR
jgi:four helix bundle protein